LTLPSPVTFDVVSLQEAVDHRGQRIEAFSIDAWDGTHWTAAPSADQTTTVGHKRLVRLTSPVATTQVRIHITDSRLEPTLSEIGLFKQAIPVPPPLISDRDAEGVVTLSDTGSHRLVYTTDGTIPTTQSTAYHSPIPLPLGGMVQAACVTPQGNLSLVASKAFPGLAPIGWKVANVDSQETRLTNDAAANAIDGKASTIWQTRLKSDLKLPHHLAVDMGSSHRIAGFTYLPRQDGSLDGVVENYRFETSVDGRHWTTNVTAGRFGNIRNNPALQEVPFEPVTARYFRFTALQEINTNGWMSAAEISVLPAPEDQR